MRVSRKEWPVSQFTGVYGMMRVTRNLDSLFCSCLVFASFSYWFLFLALCVSSHHTLSLIMIKFVESPIRVWLLSLRVSLIIHMDILVAWRLLLIRAKDCLSEPECNQHFVSPALCFMPLWAAELVTPFVTPALCHMPFEVVSVRGREHQHWERMPSGVVSWTERVEKESKWKNSREAEVEPSRTLEPCMRDRDEKMSRQNAKECEQVVTTEARILSVVWERMICL